MVEPTIFPVKRGHVKKTDLAEIMRNAFGDVEKDGEWLTSSYQLIRSIRARYDGLTKLVVENDQEKRMDDMDAAVATMKAWNSFLNEATGFNAKQRGKKAQEAAKKG